MSYYTREEIEHKLKKLGDPSENQHSLATLFECLLDGSDYERGQLEELEASLRKTQRALAVTLMALRATGAISHSELVNIIRVAQV